MTTLLDANTSVVDVTDTTELDLPAVLDPSLALSDGVLEVAYHYYVGDFEKDSKAISQAERAYATLQNTWTITDAGALEIIGSNGTTIYVVDTSVCVQKGVYRTSKKGKVSPAVCKGWIFSGGTCYHRVAYELLRIAQAMEMEVA